MDTPQPEIVLKDLLEGTLSVQGEFMWGSNYTYLLKVMHEGRQWQAVYKPTRGVRPLWDFPSDSLSRREVAAYQVSEALGWHLVPPTVYREAGPHGSGSLQLFIQHDPEYHYFNFSAADRARLQPVALFDIITNNADRKGSHILIDPQGRLWLIDHGICFHAQNKLRTVIWDFAGQPIPENLCRDLERMLSDLHPLVESDTSAPRSLLARELGQHLSASEMLALCRRGERLLEEGCFPNPDPNRRHYPWPPV